jgi:PLP dependent protein
MLTIKETLLDLTNKLRAHEIQYHRPPHSVFLLAVSKDQPASKILDAVAQGQLAFGENYLQEALAKMKEVNHPYIEWHFIGHIQSNKTRAIAENFAWVHTVCSEKIAQRLNEQRPSALPPLNICLEVNVNNEANKSGLIKSEEILALAKSCAHLPHLHLRGLMAIPAQTDIFSEQRANFHKLWLLQQMLIQNGMDIDTLSMGMTDDLEAAIAEGSTLVRVGRGIFGKRG